MVGGIDPSSNPQGPRQRRESARAARRLCLVDIALCTVMRDGVLRREEAPALTLGEIALERNACRPLHPLQVRRTRSGGQVPRQAQGIRQTSGPDTTDGSSGLSVWKLARRLVSRALRTFVITSLAATPLTIDRKSACADSAYRVPRCNHGVMDHSLCGLAAGSHVLQYTRGAVPSARKERLRTDSKNTDAHRTRLIASRRSDSESARVNPIPGGL